MENAKAEDKKQHHPSDEQIKLAKETCDKVKTLDLVRNVEGGMEPRYDCNIIVVGHFMAGKTTLIKRLLLQYFNMRETESTNGIVIMKGAFISINGDLEIIENPTDLTDVHRRMENAKAEDKKQHHPSDEQIKLAKETCDKITSSKQETHERKSNTGIKCKLHFMDFAGQSVFNSTHQVFMTHRAIYLLVLDISKALDAEIEDDDVYCVGANRRMSVKDFTKYLLNSIHVYIGDQTHSFPKVLLVGTHKDQVDEVIAKSRMKKLMEEIQDTSLKKNVRDFFIVDSSKRDDHEIDSLRRAIFEIVKKEPHWGEKTPTRWLPLEESIIDRREKGARILTLQTIHVMDASCFVNLKEEIGKFLQFHNEIGNLMYFGGTAPDDIVILDPQWLIDALKQLITHERFHKIPKGLEAAWKDFTNSAILRKELIVAVWSNNNDKTFITHKEQLLTILEQTDIIASPLVYDKEGQARTVDYYFVPSMLKPNQEGKAVVDAFLRLCRTKSPAICFVFRERFMQPAIFPRLQAACTMIYNIKEEMNKPLMFYQIAVFQLTHELDLVIRHEGHIIKIIILNENGVDMDMKICENVLFTLESTLKDIVRLYGRRRIPFYKAVQCTKASIGDNTFLTWTALKNMGLDEYKSVICKAHQPSEWHRVDSVDFVTSLNPWITRKEEEKMECPLSSRGYSSPESYLRTLHLGRLARRIDASELLLAARSKITEEVAKHSMFDNPSDIQGETFDTLRKWKQENGFLTLENIHREINASGERIRIEILTNAVADTDTSEIFKKFDQAFLDKKVSDISIALISQRSALNYRFLALELGLSNHEIETIIKDNKGVTHRASILLRMWRSRSRTPTYREIFQAIIEVNMNIKLLQDCERSLMYGPSPGEKFIRRF